MAATTLLPGVTEASTPPVVRCDARAEIRLAQRRAWVGLTLQMFLLALVDLLFVRWPECRFPFTGRETSLTLLRTANALILGQVWLVRALPRWSAHRIAETWSRRERTRFGQRQER